MTVYLLTRGRYDEWRVVGIYSTRELALQAGQAGVGRQKHEMNEYDIEEYVLDAGEQ